MRKIVTPHVQFDENTVDQVARLAHLVLSDEDRLKFTGQFNDIMAHFEQLNALDVSGVEPTTHTANIQNRLRADVPQSSIPPEQALQNASTPEAATSRLPAFCEFNYI